MHDPSSLLTQAYANFHSQTEEALAELRAVFESCSDDAALVSNAPATRFIVSWMGDHFRSLKKFSGLISRQVSPSAADQLTLAMGVTLKTFLAAKNSPAIVKSEIALERKRKAIYPDISVWSESGALSAMIECKTNLGYDRTGWTKQYEDRTEKARSLFPEADSYLCILTSLNWNFDVYEQSEFRGNRWFCLMRCWPTEITAPPDGQIIDPIEPMFIQIRDKFLSQ